MRQQYWFTCPVCGQGIASEYIENLCNHCDVHYMMVKGGKVFTAEAMPSSSQPQHEIGDK